KQKEDGIFISQDKHVAKILKKFGLTYGKSASTLIDTEKPLLKDSDGEDVDVHTYRYLKGKPHLGLWYPKDSPFNLMAYSDSDYAKASLYRKSTTGGCQFLGCRLISWQCKKQTVVATSSTKAEYVAAASCCAQVLWIQNQLLDYGNILQLNPSPKSIGVRQEKLHVSIKLFRRVTEDSEVSGYGFACGGDDGGADDADGVECLPNEEIFTELARMGYEKPLPKLTFYKDFFSAQWKFLINTLVLCISAKRTAWNEFSCLMASTVVCLATDDAAGVDCLPNEEIFTELARMGYEKPSTKLTFYKAFLAQWKFLIHIILQCMSVKRTAWNEFSSSMASAASALPQDEDDDNEVSVEPTPHLPTHATPPPSPTQEHIPLPSQAQTAQPSSPLPQQPS
nr:hypothetical protein [Tanacetum cinerariifolium]